MLVSEHPQCILAEQDHDCLTLHGEAAPMAKGTDTCMQVCACMRSKPPQQPTHTDDGPAVQATPAPDPAESTEIAALQARC